MSQGETRAGAWGIPSPVKQFRYSCSYASLTRADFLLTKGARVSPTEKSAHASPNGNHHAYVFLPRDLFSNQNHVSKDHCQQCIFSAGT